MSTSERQERIRLLARQNFRRRQREQILPLLQQVLEQDFDETKLVVIDRSELARELNQPEQRNCLIFDSPFFEKVFAIEEITTVEKFCFDFSMLVEPTQVKLLVPELDFGILDVSLHAVLGRVGQLLKLFNAVAVNAPQTLSGFSLYKHVYYYYGSRGAKECKWHLEIQGESWVEAAKHYWEGVS